MPISIVELSKTPFKGHIRSHLIVKITGVDTSIVNALRRIALRDIPIYAFDPSTIEIEFNDSIYNNDMMKLRLMQLPIFNIPSNIIFLSRKYWENVDFTDPKREKHPDDKKLIELYINAHNNTLSNLNVSINDSTMYIDGIEDKNHYTSIEPILIIQLRPNQSFKMKAKATLAIGERNDIYAACSTSFFEMENNNTFKLTLESQGQLDEYKILNIACQIAIKKLKDIKTNIENTFDKQHKHGTIELILTNEDHTIGNLINYELQNFNDVVYSGLSKPDLLIKEIKIKYLTTNNEPLAPFYKAIDNRINVFNELLKNIIDLTKSNSKSNKNKKN